MKVDLNGPRLGPLPRLYQTSAFAFWSDGPALADLAAIEGPFGAIRWGLSLSLRASTSHEDYIERLRANMAEPAWQALLAKGGLLIIGFGFMPKWLSSSQDEALLPASGIPAYEAFWPRDWAAWRRLSADVARVIYLEAGMPTDRVLLSFHNEPSSQSFFGPGMADEAARVALFATMYREWAQAVVDAVPGAQVGGPEDFVGPGFLPEFLRLVRGAPLHFLTFHSYGTGPTPGTWSAFGLLPGYLAAAGFDPNTPAYATEWNDGSTISSAPVAAHDGVEGAASFLAHLRMQRFWGVAGQTYSSWQDFGAPAGPGEDPYKGKSGALTKESLRKAVRVAMEMLSRMARAGVELPVELSLEERAAGASALAVLDGQTLRVLASRYRPADAASALLVVLTEGHGYRSVEELGVTPAQLSSFLNGGELPPEVVEPHRSRLLEARALVPVGTAESYATEVELEGALSARKASIGPGTAHDPRAAYASGGLSAAVAAGQLVLADHVPTLELSFDAYAVRYWEVDLPS